MNKRDWKTRDVSCPEPGYFVRYLVRGGPQVTARILYSDGLWRAVIDGVEYRPHRDPARAQHVSEIWHYAEMITEVEYYDRLRQRDRLIAADPNHPAARPHKPIVLTNLKPLF